MRREDGFALPLALCALVTLGLLVTTISVYATGNVLGAKRSAGSRKAQALADAGLNSALSVLQTAADSTFAGAVPAVASRDLDGGTYGYSATLSGSRWTLTGTGLFPAQPRNGVAPVSRTSRLDVDVVQTPDLRIWQYLYSDDPGACSTTLRNGVDVTAPIYVRGELCMSNSAKLLAGPLQVDGDITMFNSSTIGRAGAALASVGVGGQCTQPAPRHTCTASAGGPIYATTLTHTIGNLSRPPVDFDDWYEDASLGPMHPCAGGGGIPFHAAAGTLTFDLTPSTGYDCRSADGTARLRWVPDRHGPGTLTAEGTIFFDGNIQMTNTDDAEYTGKATIFASGTVALYNSARLCPAGGCGASWDGKTNVLMFVVGSTSSSAFALYNSSEFEGAAWVAGDYDLGNSATNWGPVVADHITIENAGQQTRPLNALPPGAPAPTVTTLQVASGTYR